VLGAHWEVPTAPPGTGEWASPVPRRAALRCAVLWVGLVGVGWTILLGRPWAPLCCAVACRQPRCCCGRPARPRACDGLWDRPRLPKGRGFQKAAARPSGARARAQTAHGAQGRGPAASRRRARRCARPRPSAGRLAPLLMACGDGAGGDHVGRAHGAAHREGDALGGAGAGAVGGRDAESVVDAGCRGGCWRAAAFSF
jgi:hypothetical protein